MLPFQRRFVPSFANLLLVLRRIPRCAGEYSHLMNVWQGSGKFHCVGIVKNSQHIVVFCLQNTVAGSLNSPVPSRLQRTSTMRTWSNACYRWATGRRSNGSCTSPISSTSHYPGARSWKTRSRPGIRNSIQHRDQEGQYTSAYRLLLNVTDDELCEAGVGGVSFCC